MNVLACLQEGPQRGEDTKYLVSLFSPTGKLFQAMHAADSDALIRFSFPPTRLPTHTQQLLALEPGR